MDNYDAGPIRLKRGADLTFPEYQPKATMLERLCRWNRKHHQALAAVEPIVRQSEIIDYDSALLMFDNDPEDTDRELDHAEAYEALTHKSYIRLMAILDGLETDTLAFIAESYNGKITGKYYDLITSALPVHHFDDIEVNSEDTNVVVKNAISYREHGASWKREFLNAFNDVRLSAPELNRPDLYNLSGADREWAVRIIKVSTYSQNASALMSSSDELDSSPHMNSGLAFLLKDSDGWEQDIIDLIDQRHLKASEITPDLVTGIRSTGAVVLNNGML